MKQKDFLGFTALTLNDLEYNVEKVQWYKLSNVLHGEIQIGVRAINFSSILLFFTFVSK